MIRFLHRRQFRFPLALLLLLVTQIAFAGQACRMVMLDGIDLAPASQESVHAGGVELTAEIPPCCAPDAAPASTCLIAFDAVHAALLAAHTPPHDFALPVADWSPPESIASSGLALRLPARSAGPPLPAYIVFRRFLS